MTAGIDWDETISYSDPTNPAVAMEACRRPAAEGGMDFVPDWGRNRLAGMLESRPDWCISRQRSWGLPIPAFYNESGRPLLTAASVRAVARGVVRMPRLVGSYDLRPVEAGTRVVYTVDSDPGGRLPAWLVKRASKDLPYFTLKNLRERAEAGPPPEG